MPQIENSRQLMQSLQVFDKLYNLSRLVDPQKKQVVTLQGNDQIRIEDSLCYQFWKKGEHCANCVSMRATWEHDTFVKIEYNQDKIYMVMATPVTLSGHPYVLELLKDISETGIVPDLKGKSQAETDQIIANLNKAAITDELTQIYNRRFLNEKLPVDLYAALLNKTLLSGILLDVDNFKEVNDTFGHSAGDIVLQKVAKILTGSIHRKGDWAARYGGDEFIVMLPGADLTSALQIAEQIRNAVEQQRFQYQGKNISLTISCGVAEACPQESTSMLDFFNRLDKKLYEAKKKGKNSVAD